MIKPISKKRKAYGIGMRVVTYTAVTIVCALVLFVVGYVLVQGLPNITWQMLSTSPSYLKKTIGILPDILSTLYLVIATLVIMNLPTIIRTTQESLKTVPQSYREGAFALGAGKWRVIRTVVLPSSIDGIVTGCILSIGRILGESAALLFTAGFAHTLYGPAEGLVNPGASLTVALYVYAKEQGEFEVAFAIAAILILFTLLINLSASLVGKIFKRRVEQ